MNVPVKSRMDIVPQLTLLVLKQDVNATSDVLILICFGATDLSLDNDSVSDHSEVLEREQSGSDMEQMSEEVTMQTLQQNGQF